MFFPFKKKSVQSASCSFLEFVLAIMMKQRLRMEKYYTLNRRMDIINCITLLLFLAFRVSKTRFIFQISDQFRTLTIRDPVSLTLPSNLQKHHREAIQDILSASVTCRTPKERFFLCLFLFLFCFPFFCRFDYTMSLPMRTFLFSDKLIILSRQKKYYISKLLI